MRDEEIGVIYGMMLSAQSILKQASAKLSRDGGIAGSPQFQAQIELATADQAIEMVRYWVAKTKK